MTAATNFSSKSADLELLLYQKNAFVKNNWYYYHHLLGPASQYSTLEPGKYAFLYKIFLEISMNTKEFIIFTSLAFRSAKSLWNRGLFGFVSLQP